MYIYSDNKMKGCLGYVEVTFTSNITINDLFTVGLSSCPRFYHHFYTRVSFFVSFNFRSLKSPTALLLILDKTQGQMFGAKKKGF